MDFSSSSIIVSGLGVKEIPSARTKEGIAYRTLQRSIARIGMSSAQRASEPYENHPWVYAAASAIARNASQVPFVIYRETEEELKRREDFSRKHYKKWDGPLRGWRRSAIQRHLRKSSRFKGVLLKGLEPDLLHPLSQLFYRVNPFTVDSQLWQLTILDMLVKGEHFWRLTNENGEPVNFGEIPAQIWPTSPNCMEPLIIRGRFLGWRFSQKTDDGSGGYSGRVQMLDFDQVVQFKFANPENPIRGLSPLSSVVASIKLDLGAVDHTSAVISEGADPGGLLVNKEGFFDEKEEEEFLVKWEQRHKGEKKHGRTGILSGPWEYHQTGMTPQDMGWDNLRFWNRDEVLAVLGTPKSVLGVTDVLNYATQLGQDKNFWDKNLIPMLRYFEAVIDGTLLFEEPDNVVGAFDLSGVDALRAGLKDQVDIANNLTGPNLHVPPFLAFEKVGIEIEDYEGSEVCLVNPLLSPVEQVVSGENLQDPGYPKPDEDEDEDEISVTTLEPPISQNENRVIRAKVNKLSYWKKYIAILHLPMMQRVSLQWRRFVGEEKQLQLEKFDKLADEKLWTPSNIAMRLFETEDGYKPYAKAVKPESVVLDLEESAKRLGAKIRPIYSKSLEDIYDYTVKEIGGIAIFELDDPDIISFYVSAEKTLVGSAPYTIQKNVLKTMRAGIEAGETVGQLRQRIAAIYDISASSAKTLQIARTETTPFLNGAREVMMKKAQIEESEWVTANDENVRDDHTAFGESGPHPLGFNYMTVVGKPGTLTYPGERGAPMDQIINCRCCQIPVL